jgi:two-component system, cell cycle response regulator CpdR
MAKILLAEDEEALAVFVERALTQAGHTVRRVPDGLEATKALAAERFALLVSDIVMPGLDGIALALKAAKDHPEMKILLMSGYAEERQRAHNLDALANRVIAKPFTLAELAEAVEKTLAE